MKGMRLVANKYLWRMFERYKFHILLHVIIFMWGFTGILGKLIHIEALYIVWYRVLIAFVSLLIGLFLLKRPAVIHDKKRFLQAVGVGLIVAIHWVTFYSAIQMSTASLGILCLSTTTLHVTWLEPLVMKKPFSPVEFLFGLLVIFGIWFVSDNFSGKELYALAVGLFSAFCAALFAVFNAKLSEDTPTSAITLTEMGTGFVFLSIVLLALGKTNATMFVMRAEDLGWLLFLGILCTSFAFLATLEVVKKLGAFTVSLSINLEPVYTILLAIPILHENMALGPDFYLGALLIIFVVVANAIFKYWVRMRQARRAEIFHRHELHDDPDNAEDQVVS
jgi:drug/metabolite transporter (DMT)-like permease